MDYNHFLYASHLILLTYFLHILTNIHYIVQLTSRYIVLDCCNFFICFISGIINITANLQHHSMTRLLYVIMGGSRNKPLGVSRESPELLNQIIYDHTCNNIVNE